MPFEMLQVGDKVISALGHPGVIAKLRPEDRYPSVDFDWDNGSVSDRAFHMQCDKITFEEELRNS